MKNTLIKKFYLTYRKLEKLINKEIEDEFYSVELLNKIIVLFFLEKKGIFNNKNLLETKLKEIKNNQENYYNDFLIPLFNDLSTNGKNLYPIKIKIFNDPKSILISNELSKIIIETLKKYNWNLNLKFTKEIEDRTISPVILMHIFEKYVNRKDTGKDKGAFYTPKDTTSYIASNSIFLSIFEKIKNEEEIKKALSEEYKLKSLEDLIQKNINIKEFLKTFIEEYSTETILMKLNNIINEIKILDPTCGSGAFVFESIDILYDFKLAILMKKRNLKMIKKIKSPFSIYKSIIEKNIYGVDIMDESIELLNVQIYLKLISLATKKELKNIEINTNFLSGNTLVGNNLTEKKINLNGFNWNENFPEIKSGFDCIVGNPPYVEYAKIKKNGEYLVKGYETEKSGNIYAFVLERSLKLLKKGGIIGMIVPISIISTKRMSPIRKFIEQQCEYSFYSNFGDRPGCLFNGVHQKLSILISKKKDINNLIKKSDIYITDYIHWYDEERAKIYNKLSYYKLPEDLYHTDFYYKIGNKLQSSILKKVQSKEKTVFENMTEEGVNIYFGMRISFWGKCFLTKQNSSEYKNYTFSNEIDARVMTGLFNSSLFYMYWELISDCWHITNKELKNIKIDLSKMPIALKNKIAEASEQLEDDIYKNREYVGTKQTEYEYKHKFSKRKIDILDELFGQYYELDEKELIYIKNYNLEYRMSDALDEYLKGEKRKKEKKKKITVLDLFAGAGGFSKGFEKSGFDIAMANEIDSEISKTHEYNHPNTLMINENIINFNENYDEILKMNLGKIQDKKMSDEIKDKINNIGIVIGGPPCQGFSMAGARIRNSEEGFIEDPRNFLFREYFKIIQRFEPEFFIMENVEGLKSMKDGEILNEIINIFENSENFKNGQYYISHKVISADQFGVPQKRKRLILIGAKKKAVDFEKTLKKAKKKLIKKNPNRFNNVSLKDAINDLNFLEKGESSNQYLYEPKSSYQFERRGDMIELYNHKATRHNDTAVNRIKQILPGRNWEDLNETINSVHSGAYGRLTWEGQSMTITTRFDTPTGGRFIHPERHRTLTPREAARIQSFDDDYVFLGKKTSVGKQIGNAVPPLVSEVLATMLKIEIEEKKL